MSTIHMSIILISKNLSNKSNNHKSTPGDFWWRFQKDFKLPINEINSKQWNSRVKTHQRGKTGSGKCTKTN